MALPPQPASPIHSAKKILLLYTYGDGLRAYGKARADFWPVITDGGVSPEDIFSEYLDLQHNKPEYRRKLADLLRLRYGGKQIELIVTVHTEVLRGQRSGFLPAGNPDW